MAENKATAGPRQTSPAKYVAIVFLVASSIGAYWVATSAQQAPGLLHVDPTALDIGEVWESDSFAWSLPIQNRGAADCHIIGFLNSCNCVSIEPTALTIRTGQTESLALRLNLGGGDSRASDSVREFTTHIQPLFAGNERYHPPWTITEGVANRFHSPRHRN